MTKVLGGIMSSGGLTAPDRGTQRRCAFCVSVQGTHTPLCTETQSFLHRNLCRRKHPQGQEKCCAGRKTKVAQKRAAVDTPIAEKPVIAVKLDRTKRNAVHAKYPPSEGGRIRCTETSAGRKA
jgi:hypothetical protein